MRPLFRPQPQLPAQAMKTYGIVAPSDRLVEVACEQVDCNRWREGWSSPIDESTDLGRRQAAYIRTYSGRSFREERLGALTMFHFAAGQRCFAEHRTRPEIYIVRDGDFRGNPRGTEPRIHSGPQAWIADFGEHQERLADRLREG